MGAHLPAVRPWGGWRLDMRGDGYKGALGLGSGGPHEQQVGKPRDHACLEGGSGWSHFWKPPMGGESQRPGVLAGQASLKIVLGRPRAGLSPGETGTGAGTYGPQKTGRWALWMVPDRCAWSRLSAGSLGVSLCASMTLLHRAGLASEPSLDIKRHACRGALEALPGRTVPEPRGGSPGDGGPAGMGLGAQLGWGWPRWNVPLAPRKVSSGRWNSTRMGVTSQSLPSPCPPRVPVLSLPALPRLVWVLPGAGFPPCPKAREPGDGRALALGGWGGAQIRLLSYAPLCCPEGHLHI